MSGLVIGGVELKHRTVLAPMAGVTDLPFRLLCAEQGAGLCGMEMISAKAILYGNRNTETLMEIDPAEGPVSLQLFGSDPEILGEIAARIQERPFTFLDINFGCPVPKIVNNGEGSALMKNPALIERIVDKTVRSIRKPVTVKIRKGFDGSQVNAVEVAKAAEAAGAAAVAVHGRTREQYYSGKADWEIIAGVKKAVRIPVIGNGDVDSPEAAAAMLEQTGCDGVMIGRAARGNPFLFAQINAWLEEGERLPPPDKSRVGELVLRHADLQRKVKGEYTGIREMRKHLSWYTSGYPGSARFRQRINAMESFDELRQCVEELFA